MKRILKKLLAPVIREVVDERIKELGLVRSLSDEELEKVVQDVFQKALSSSENPKR
ncbi:MAG: hypothetical protein ACTTJM_09145 [Bergeyella cardium]